MFPLLRASLLLVFGVSVTVIAGEKDAESISAKLIAARVDQLMATQMKSEGLTAAEECADEDYLRRVTLDLAGRLPTRFEMLKFERFDEPNKRELIIDRLLASEDYGANWARYWRDVIYRRATNRRAGLSISAFESWLQGELNVGTGWDTIAEQIITASGDVRENGAAGLIFAQEGEPEDIAAEVSRIFLGIQIQCANCHDHPTDKWKREQFHELTAFFTRINLRQIRDAEPVTYEIQSVNRDRSGQRQRPQMSSFAFRRLDANRDGKLSQREVEETRLGPQFERLLRFADKNADEMLTLNEIVTAEPPPMQQRPGQGSTEHYMPDLDDPASRGTKVDPVFFVNHARLRSGMDDEDRRRVLANYVTSKSNPWFATAIVNRMWNELLGSGFYSPVDDIGPERTPMYPESLQLLTSAFVANDYDLRWLLKAIVSTRAYERTLKKDASGDEVEAFAVARPTRLRSDQLFDAMIRVLGIEDSVRRRSGQMMAGAGGRGGGGMRFAFNAVFGFDPSTPQNDIIGSIPQALFMMNSPIINRSISSKGRTQLASILRDYPNDVDAITQLYRLVLSRRPTDREEQICRDYLDESTDRGAAFEDLQWSLLNSTEFLTRR